MKRRPLHSATQSSELIEKPSLPTVSSEIVISDGRQPISPALRLWREGAQASNKEPTVSPITARMSPQPSSAGRNSGRQRGGAGATPPTCAQAGDGRAHVREGS